MSLRPTHPTFPLYRFRNQVGEAKGLAQGDTASKGLTGLVLDFGKHIAVEPQGTLA